MPHIALTYWEILLKTYTELIYQYDWKYSYWVGCCLPYLGLGSRQSDKIPSETIYQTT